MGNLGLSQLRSLVRLCEGGAVAAEGPRSQLRCGSVTDRVAPGGMGKDVSLTKYPAFLIDLINILYHDSF